MSRSLFNSNRRHFSASLPRLPSGSLQAIASGFPRARLSGSIAKTTLPRHKARMPNMERVLTSGQPRASSASRKLMRCMSSEGRASFGRCLAAGFAIALADHLTIDFFYSPHLNKSLIAGRWLLAVSLVILRIRRSQIQRSQIQANTYYTVWSQPGSLSSTSRIARASGASSLNHARE